MKTVSAVQANRRFSSALREAIKGETVLATSHGKPRTCPSDGAAEAPPGRLCSSACGASTVLTRSELYDEIR
jgi:hypothetical protein